MTDLKKKVGSFRLKSIVKIPQNFLFRNDMAGEVFFLRQGFVSKICKSTVPKIPVICKVALQKLLSFSHAQKLFKEFNLAKSKTDTRLN